jgi:hypothetical protein
MDLQAAAGRLLPSSSPGGEANSTKTAFSKKAGSPSLVIKCNLAQACTVFVLYLDNIYFCPHPWHPRPSPLSWQPLPLVPLHKDNIHHNDDLFVQSLCKLRGAHELAGRALCNSGHNDLLLFHFGMAWSRVSCHGLLAGDDDEDWEWKRSSVADYPQMYELSGFLKLGMLALLFYRAEGCSHNNYYYCYYDKDNNDNCTTMQGRHVSECGRGCGCGVVGCSKSPCYVAFLETLPIVDGVLEALALANSSMILAAGNGNFHTALDVLAKMACIMCRLDSIDIESGCGHISGGGLITETSMFLAKCSTMRDVPPILRFWEGRDWQD